MEHIPVLKDEVLEVLKPKPGENFVDCTLGWAGHTKAILEAIKPSGKVLGIEWDKDVVEQIKKENIENLILVNGSYANLKEILEREGFDKIGGVLLDLGLSSWDFEQSGRGFSFQKDEPLDMRYSTEQTLTATEIINKWSEEGIAKIFKDYGQERFAKPIASRIVFERDKKPINTTFELIDVARKGFPRSYKFGKAHFATRVFQALRIAVNGELDNLKIVLPQTLEVLGKGGRIAVISFHSLEDKIVKNFFKEKSKLGEIEILTKKPISPKFGEVKINKRARTAKLRAAIKL